MSEQCQCRRCLRERNEGAAVAGVFIPGEALQMIVCQVCGDKRCVHAYDHEAPCAKTNIYGHNSWVERHWLLASNVKSTELFKHMQDSVLYKLS